MLRKSKVVLWVISGSRLSNSHAQWRRWIGRWDKTILRIGYISTYM